MGDRFSYFVQLVIVLTLVCCRPSHRAGLTRPKIIHCAARPAVFAYTVITCDVRRTKSPVSNRTADPSTTAPQTALKLKRLKCLEAYLSRLPYQQSSRLDHSM